ETLHRLVERVRTLLPARLRGGAAVVPVVRMSGVIGFSTPLRPGLTISSIVGSIGVVGGTFGFNRLLERLGIERRIYTAGERKVMLDPFQPEKPEDVAHLKAIQQDIHEGFIALVKGRRGAALTGPESDLFNGEYCTGRKAQDLGLVDRIGDLRGTLRERYGENVRMPLISAERGLFGRRVPGVDGGGLAPFAGVGFAEEIVSALEARALWARYGL